MSKRKGISYQKRKSLYGYGFIGLWLVGTVIFFLIPLAKSLWYALSDVKLGSGKLTAEWSGLKNFSYVLNVDEHYADYLRETIIEILWKTPLILIFSLFIAVILNQHFKGRTLARAIFFLPVIIATGPVYKIISGDMGTSGNMGAGQFSTMFTADFVGELMQFLGIYGLTENMGEIIRTITDNIFGIVWNAGIQILLFLAALQGIPSTAREAAMIEGATAWEYFWKVTFPYVSPFILTNSIFTIVDSFRSPANKVMGRIMQMKEDWSFGYASAMSWIYFGIVLLMIGVLTFVINKFIYYETD